MVSLLSTKVFHCLVLRIICVVIVCCCGVVARVSVVYWSSNWWLWITITNNVLYNNFPELLTAGPGLQGSGWCRQAKTLISTFLAPLIRAELVLLSSCRGEPGQRRDSTTLTLECDSVCCPDSPAQWGGCWSWLTVQILSGGANHDTKRVR